MISSVPSHDEQQQQQQQQQDELLNGARANIGLLADGIWAPLGRDDPYRKLNQALWTRCCKIASNYAEIQAGSRPKKKRVRDVIPESRLASYGDYEYEDEPEQPVQLVEEPRARRDSGERTAEAEKKVANGEEEGAVKEPWMLDEVEEYVARLSAAAVKRPRRAHESLLKYDGTLKDSQKMSKHATSIQEDTNKDSIDNTSDKKYNPPRFRVTNVSEAQLEGRIFSEAIRNLWRTNPSPPPSQQQQQQRLRQCQSLLRPPAQPTAAKQQRTSDIQQTHSSFQNERLRMPSRCQYSYVQAINMLHRPQLAPPPLCVDVPEFFPKAVAAGVWPVDQEHAAKQQQQQQIQFYTPASSCSAENNPYQEELFPYKGPVASRKTVTVYQNTLVPMVPTPIVSAMVWPSQAWAAQRMLPAPIQIHQMPPPASIPPPPQTLTIQSQPQLPPVSMCPTVVHRPIRIQESVTKPTPLQQQQQQQHQSGHKGQIPVYQRPGKVVQDYQQRRKSQGVDFNNLILLTKSAMKVRKNQTKGTKKSFAADSAKLQTGAVIGKVMDAGSARWFDKGCQQKREREYVTVSTTTPPRLQSSSRISESGGSGSAKDSYSLETRSRASQSADEEFEMPSRKRLYRDVLGSASTSPVPTAAAVVEDSSFEMRYDELERQAMEQYRTSEECLALRYQELEQQALEQYRNAGSSESLSLDFDNQSTGDIEARCTATDDVEQQQQPERCSSGFGKSNPLKKAPVATDEKGESIELQQRIKILKAENSGGGGGGAKPAVVHRAASEGSLRPIAVARRLAAISGPGCGYARESKNTLRGASGEKIVKTSSLSSLKRRLMPMSPLERNKSGANLMKNPSLDPMKAVQTLDKHVAAYYRNTKVIQTGSGDDKANNAGVWLSDFWS